MTVIIILILVLLALLLLIGLFQACFASNTNNMRPQLELASSQSEVGAKHIERGLTLAVEQVPPVLETNNHPIQNSDGFDGVQVKTKTDDESIFQAISTLNFDDFYSHVSLHKKENWTYRQLYLVSSQIKLFVEKDCVGFQEKHAGKTNVCAIAHLIANYFINKHKISLQEAMLRYSNVSDIAFTFYRMICIGELLDKEQDIDQTQAKNNAFNFNTFLDRYLQETGELTVSIEILSLLISLSQTEKQRRQIKKVAFTQLDRLMAKAFYFKEEVWHFNKVLGEDCFFYHVLQSEYFLGIFKAISSVYRDSRYDHYLNMTETVFFREELCRYLPNNQALVKNVFARISDNEQWTQPKPNTTDVCYQENGDMLKNALLKAFENQLTLVTGFIRESENELAKTYKETEFDCLKHIPHDVVDELVTAFHSDPEGIGYKL